MPQAVALAQLASPSRYPATLAVVEALVVVQEAVEAVVVEVHHRHLLVLQQAVVGVVEVQVVLGVGQVVVEAVEAVVVAQEALVVQVVEEVVHHQHHQQQAQARHHPQLLQQPALIMHHPHRRHSQASTRFAHRETYH
jgi:hypothetical protein